MNEKFNAVYDESCMYPLPGENEAAFMKRIDALCKMCQDKMTPEEKRIADLLATGKMTPEVLKTLIVEEY